MDGPCEVDLIPRPGVKIITSTKSTAVVSPNKPLGRQPVTACNRLRHLKWLLKTFFAASSGGAGDAPTQKHVEENLLKGCDPVLLEVHQLAMLQSQHYLQTGTTAQSEVLGLSWGLLAMLSKSHGMVSGNDIANLLLHKHLDSNELEACRAFCSFAKGTTNLATLLIAGKTKEAVEHVRRQGAWHHALILKNLEKNGPSDCIMSRFIKNLDDSDLMKTYYLVRVGEMPIAAPGCGVDVCGNWHLHLAIVVGICNTSLRKEFVAKLAETLASKGLWHAAHFCQMVLQLDSDLLPKASLHSLVGEWMGLLAKMQKETTQASPVASAQHPMNAEERKVPLSENNFKNLAGPLLPPAVAHHVPKTDEAPVEVTQEAPVDSGKLQVPVDHGKKKVPLSEEDFRKLIGPLHPPPVSVPKALKKEAKQSTKMSWLSRFSCFGSRTMD